MKYHFSGDKEFAFDNYSSLPYKYVLEAYEKSLTMHRRDLHYAEAPQALQTSLLANINRDPKKSRKPFTMEDFCMYQLKEDRDIPNAEFGAAAMALVEKRMFPVWALFAFKDLKESAQGPPPSILCYTCDDLIILAPRNNGDVVQGMVIAMHSSSNQIRALTSPCHKSIMIKVPEFNSKYFCQENVAIDLIIS